MGYAQFPGGNPATDGVVILYSSVGSRKKVAGGTYVTNYDLGRTATHEIGHWMNLRHIWGDAACGNDFVGDTPLHNAANTGCPSADHRSTCTGTPLEMWMNYMDYTYDACMYMFSNGQKDRMLAAFAAGGPRASFAQ
ncbi:M43 family zinc metalloprotease [Flavisolibacter tropicus]|uniref:M43 family zinc metalloprotease n=1 Tax=Flavisolibacter tropicus TaxID=1492898 RepID=UPI000A8AC414|nr:M43 family zinc metalloprotease [Flavisolibacter tropicus]